MYNWISECIIAHSKASFIEVKRVKYEGKVWFPFWSQFPIVENADTINSNVNIQYFIIATSPNSEAGEVVDYQANGEMYPEPIKVISVSRRLRHLIA